eukprot:346386-Hanusia_phi.AAC.1
MWKGLKSLPGGQEREACWWTSTIPEGTTRCCQRFISGASCHYGKDEDGGGGGGGGGVVVNMITGNLSDPRHCRSSSAPSVVSETAQFHQIS